MQIMKMPEKIARKGENAFPTLFWQLSRLIDVLVFYATMKFISQILMTVCMSWTSESPVKGTGVSCPWTLP